MGRITEMTSSGGYPTVKIVLERCPRTEKALKELQNYHHHHPVHCSVCGGNEELIDLQNYAWTPLQSQLFKKRVLEWTLEVSGGGGRGGDSLTTHDGDEFGWGCEGCMTQFEMLALVQRRIADLENQEKEIVSQLKKTIGNRLGVISQPNLPGTEPEATTSVILDVDDEDPSTPTPIMTDAPTDEYVDLDLNPFILDGVLVDEVQDKNPLQSQLDEDADDGLCKNTISEEEEMNDPDQGGTVEDEPSPKKSRRCKARATQIISAILKNDYEIDDDNDESDSPKNSPKTESDTDSDNTNDELEPHTGKGRYKLNGGGMSSNPSTNVQIEDDKHIGSVCGKQVGSDGQTFSCETCHKTFSAKRYLYSHRKRVHLKQLRHKCKKCGKGFYRPFNLQRHLKLRIPCTEFSKKKKFICPICKDGFTTERSLATHTRTAHNGEKRTKCPHPKCNYHYFDKTKLKRHLKIHHSRDEKEISCTICNQKFSRVAEKLAHIKSSHTCGFCNKSFPNKPDLDEHRKTHTGDRPYVCTECGKTFSQKKGLDHHLRTTPCNPDKDEIAKIRKVMNNRQKKWVAKKKGSTASGSTSVN